MSELRLAIGDPEGRHGLSWRVWTSNDSIYLSCRVMKGTQKVSVHPPSEKGPQVAFFHGTEEAHRENMEFPDDPRIERYYPRELGPGVRRIGTIRACLAALQTTAPVKKPASVYWLTPPEDHGADIQLLLVERRDDAHQWVASRNFEPQLAIMDESSLGDVLIYGEFHTEWPSLTTIGQFDNPDPANPSESVAGQIGVVAHRIESRDGSLLMEELPVWDRSPFGGRQATASNRE